MLRLLKDRRFLISVVAVAGLAVMALWPETQDVELAAVSRGAVVVTIDEEGRTRIHDRFVISAPVTGRVLRIDLEPGDTIRRGDVVARVLPEVAPLLDERSRAEAEATVAGATAAFGRARADEERTRAALDHAAREVERSRRLSGAGAISVQTLEAQEAELRVAEETARAAAFAVRAASAELERAQARLSAPPGRSGSALGVRAPADGVVLRILRESESVVPAGEPLLEVGDPRELEIVVDLLSADAVRVRPGARATIESWGDEGSFEARVRRIEPAGFTKVSALGVEEQRVNVILDFVDSFAAYAVLGDAYRVEVRIVVAEARDALKLPTSALFRDGAAWAAYVARDGKAVSTTIDLGLQTGQEAEVLSGLNAGDRVIVHPGDLIADGVRIRERKP